MDMQAPDRTPTASPPSPGFVARMVKDVAAATPNAIAEETTAGDAQAIRELLDCLNPRDTADAQLAAIAIAAARSAMDNFARAARAGISDDQAVRLRGNGLAAGRAYAMALRYFRKRQADAAPVKPAARSAAPPDPPAAQPAPPVPPGFIALRPGATPIPAVETFQPHDRFGRPIPEGRIDLMTRAQARASLAWPRDPVLEAAAITDEEAMISEQKANEARDAETRRLPAGADAEADPP